MKKEYINIEKPTEIQIAGKETDIMMSCGNTVTLQKMFGPTIFADLRITPDLDRGGWIVERFGLEDYEEYALIPAQIDGDFYCEECNEKQEVKDGKCKDCLFSS